MLSDAEMSVRKTGTRVLRMMGDTRRSSTGTQKGGGDSQYRNTHDNLDSIILTIELILTMSDVSLVLFR